jgi:hypothetical protein
VGIAADLDVALRHDPHLLDVAAVLGIAILAVVIATITVLTVFLTEDYGILLRAQYDDVGEVFFPYRLIAAVSCATTVVAALGLFVWPASPPWANVRPRPHHGRSRAFEDATSGGQGGV